MTARAFDLERELGEIVNGLRLAAEAREADADARTFRGDLEGAGCLRRAAAYMRAKADAAVQDLARVRRARVESPEYVAGSAMIAQLAGQDRQAERERQVEQQQRAQERVAAARRGRAA